MDPLLESKVGSNLSGWCPPERSSCHEVPPTCKNSFSLLVQGCTAPGGEV